MPAYTYGDTPALCGSALPLLWKGCAPRSRFGDVAVIVFLLAQCCDGVFTYVGVTAFGISVEANPVIAELMIWLGHGTGLLLAKSAAAGLGIALHLRRVHGAVALLATFYIAAAVLPWAAILFS
jgi:hypothetical protein